MDFQFEKGSKDLIATLAFALYKDNSICVSWHDTPIDISSMTHILGCSIVNSLVSNSKIMDEVPYPKRRDRVHELIRLFADGLNAEIQQAAWHNAQDSSPSQADSHEIMFTLLDNGEQIFYGHYDIAQNAFVDEHDSGRYYPASRVAYWMCQPKAPLTY